MNILLISNCRLGDSLALIPVLKLLRERYAGAFVCLVSEQVGRGFVGAEAILGGRGLIDEFVPMEMGGNPLARLWSRLRLFRRMRARRWELGMVLIPPMPPLTQALSNRLAAYLRLCGAARIIAPTDIAWRDEKAALQLARLLEPTLDETALDFALPPLATPLRVELPEDKRLLAVAPGANLPLKVWPLERFASVLRCLPDNVHPVYFGGENERGLCEELAGCVPGTLFVGRPMPEVEAAIRKCACYLGNDTGLMHLAAACGVKCVALFSGHSRGRAWEPCGAGHECFRHVGLPCEGCLARECPLGTRECMANHNIEAVIEAIRSRLER